MSDDDRKPIEPPQKAPGRKVARDLSDAVVGQVPVVGPLITAAWRTAFPPIEDQNRERWEQKITNETNRLATAVDDLLPGTIQIEGLPAELAVFLTKLSEDGLCHHFDLGELAAQFPNQPSGAALVEAAEELAAYGLVEFEHFAEGEGLVWPTPELFQQLDPEVMGWRPAEDAREIAALLLKDGSNGSVASLHEATAWSKRRFNPAMQYLLRFFSENRISQEIQPDYPTNYVMLDGAVKARLRRFVQAGA